MGDRWHPEKDLEQLARRFVARVAAQVRRTAPRKPHRSSEGGPVGGSLAAKVRRKGLVVLKPWGVVIDWPSLGQVWLWFVKGTKRQKERPVDLSPKDAEVEQVVRESAAAHFEQRERRAEQRRFA